MVFCSLRPWFGVMLYSLLIHFLSFQHCFADGNSTLVVNASFDKENARKIPQSFHGVFFEVCNLPSPHMPIILTPNKMDSGVSFFIVWFKSASAINTWYFPSYQDLAMTLLKFDRNFIWKTWLMATPLMLNRFLNNVQ